MEDLGIGLARLGSSAARMCVRSGAIWVRDELTAAGWRAQIAHACERLRRRTHLVQMRALAMNRIFGLQTQWGLRISLQRLRSPDAMVLLDTIPGSGDLLGLTPASEIGDVARVNSPRKLIGCADVAPKISQSGDR